MATLTVPAAWLIERVVWRRALLPMATLGRSSLFAYWIHIEMVYGVIAEPIKQTLPLWQSLIGTVLITLVVYWLVVAKNRWLERHELTGSLRWLAPVLR